MMWETAMAAAARIAPAKLRATTSLGSAAMSGVPSATWALSASQNATAAADSTPAIRYPNRVPAATMAAAGTMAASHSAEPDSHNGWYASALPSSQ